MLFRNRFLLLLALAALLALLSLSLQFCEYLGGGAGLTLKQGVLQASKEAQSPCPGSKWAVGLKTDVSFYYWMAGSRSPQPLNGSGIFPGLGTSTLTRPCDPGLASAQIPKLPGYSRILRFPETLSGPACFPVMPSLSELRQLTFWLVLCGLCLFYVQWAVGRSCQGGWGHQV